MDKVKAYAFAHVANRFFAIEVHEQIASLLILLKHASLVSVQGVQLRTVFDVPIFSKA